MTLKEGDYFSYEEYKQSLLNLYNLGLFSKIEIIPIPVSSKELVLNVDVSERWYIIPLPAGGLEDGEWAKKWIGLNFRWDNFRGRNETLGFSFRILYNPSINGYYTIPWIGNAMQLSTTIGAGAAKIKNRSLALGRKNGSSSLNINDPNFDNLEFNSMLNFAKHLTRKLSLYLNLNYNYIRVTQPGQGRTESPSGKDNYFSIGPGINFDSRNLLDYTTKGYYFNAELIRYGYAEKELNYGKFNLESRSFIPISFTKTYFVTIASRIYTSLSIGSTIPYYNDVYLGYWDDYVRGWLGRSYEGNQYFTFYNELRIPILLPEFINSGKLPIVKNTFLNNIELKYGLFFTVFYDLGSVWNNYERLSNKSFMSGTGIGLNAVLPFGFIGRLEWGIPIAKPLRGQIVVTLNARI